MAKKTVDFERFNPKLLRQARVVDRLLRPFFFLSGRKNFSKLKDLSPKKIMLLESHLIGDSVQLAPLIVAIKRMYPNVELHLVGHKWLEALFSQNEKVDRIEVMDIPWVQRKGGLLSVLFFLKSVLRLRREKYDLSIETRGDIRNGFLLYLTGAKRRVGYVLSGGDYFLTDPVIHPGLNVHLAKFKFEILRELGWNEAMPEIELRSSELIKKEVEKYLQELKLDGPVIAIHSGASMEHKSLPQEKLIELVERLRKITKGVLLVGGPNEKPFLDAINERLSPPQPVFVKPLDWALGLCEQVSCVVAMDSGMAHIAAAAGCPTVCVFWHQHADITKPLGKVVEVVVPVESKVGIEYVSIQAIVSSVEKLLKNSK